MVQAKGTDLRNEPFHFITSEFDCRDVRESTGSFFYRLAGSALAP